MYALLLALAGPGTFASDVTGGTLYEACDSTIDRKFDACNAYIIGVADTLQIAHLTCQTNSGSGTIQTIAIARKYIESHPEKWSNQASVLIKDALIAAFPCNRR